MIIALTTTAEATGVPSDLAIVGAILTASVIVFGAIWRLVKATWGGVQVTRDNSKALLGLSTDIKDMSTDIRDLKEGLEERVTVAQHQGVVDGIKIGRAHV